MNKHEIAAFNEAAEAYIEMFGGSLPLGIGMPNLTTELLQKAVADKKPIESNTPPGALS